MSGFIYTENIEKIHKNIATLENKLNNLQLDQIKGEKPTLVVLLGGTGSGKSTFMHILAGRKLVLREDKYGVPILDSEVPWEEFKIGHGHDSETEIPGIWFDRTRNIIFCDCPGFYDTKGPMQEVVNLFAIVSLLNLVNQLKIALMIRQEDAVSLRGQQSRKQFNMIENLSKEKSSPKGISLIITHAEEKLKRQRKLKGILHDMGEDDENNLINLVSKDIDKRIFIFLEPDPNSNVNSQYQEFSQEDLHRFLNFVNDKSDMFQPNKKVPMNETSLLFILSVINSLDNMNLLIQEITAKIRDDYEYEIDMSPNLLNKWTNNINSLKSKRFSNLNCFITTLEQTFKGYKYSSIYEKIRRIEFFLPIIERIDFSKLKNQDSNTLKNFMDTVSMIKIEECFHDGLNHILNEISREKQRRNAEEQRKQEFEKRLQAEEEKARAENRTKDLENQRKRLIEEREKEEANRISLEKENKRKQALIRQYEEQRRIDEEQKRKSDEQTRLLEQELKHLQSQPAKIIHIYHGGGGGCNIF